ncbi:B-cell receptor CD22-like [Saccostrea echinata]|uniref:B-cell receptor CD22-like n=1 Tax=Saccostrea echinata TaxID=191078 RepID=UPI002A829E34|nr:B-cell receptor CD22-like [Saccostrea echinata]
MMAFRCIVTMFLNTLFIFRNAGQQLPAYVIENSPGCINTSVTSWNISDNFPLIYLKKENKNICTLGGIPGKDPYIDIIIEYRDRISCGIDVNQKQTFFCFTNAVNILDAGVYSAELTTGLIVYNNTLYVMRPPTKPIISLQGDLINQKAQNLTCYAASTSLPVTGLLMTYSWTDNGAAITDSRFTFSGQGNKVLMINRVRKEDQGKKIQCIATEDKGTSSVLSDLTILDVLYKPEVSTPISSPYNVLEGQTATMTCSVTAANPHTDIRWSWIKKDSPSYVLDTGLNYTISNIQRNQSGIYNCRATNSIGMSTPASIHVDVQYKPEVSTPISSPFKVVEGQTATMTCSVTAANPHTDIRWSWIKKDSPSYVLDTGLNYTISNIQRNQSGIYNCRATNSIGMSTPASIHVDVQYKPEVSTPISSPYKVVEGQTATMTCSVTAANPNTDIRWSWIKTDSPSNVLHTGLTYTISNTHRNQTGIYKCRASNSIGMSTPATIYVDVQYKPEVSTTTSSPYKVVEGQTAILTCSVTAANPNTDIRWSWIKTDSPSNVLHTGPTYTISNIQRGQSGNYNCRATNSIEMSTPTTIPVEVQYGPTSVMFSPDVMTINKTENQTTFPIVCSAVCNPNCTYRWTGVTTVNSGLLNLGVLKRTERGDYTCTASNSIKSTSRTISVYVNYPPTIEVFQASGNRTYEESSPFSITCKVDSYPLSDINILNVDTGEVKASDGLTESLTYRESSAKCYHTANYACNSKNSYGITSSVVQRIVILCM